MINVLKINCGLLPLWVECSALIMSSHDWSKSYMLISGESHVLLRFKPEQKKLGEGPQNPYA